MAFCERQWGAHSYRTAVGRKLPDADGRVLHDHVHDVGSESRKTLIVVRGMPLHSIRLGISGQADALSFRVTTSSDPDGVMLPDKLGRWRPVPVEYKRGKPKKQICDLVQAAPRRYVWRRYCLSPSLQERCSTPLPVVARLSHSPLNCAPKPNVSVPVCRNSIAAVKLRRPFTQAAARAVL